MTAGPLGLPWSSGAVRGADGAVRVAGVDVRDLAAAHGTPAYVVDEADLRARARGYREAFEAACAQVGTGVDVYYAGKALLTRAVARWVHEEGLRVDTASGGELAVALAAGVPGEHLGLHGNNKSDDELRAALDAGVGRIIVDSLVEVDRLAALVRDHRGAGGAPAPVMVRVTTGVHAGGHEFISTAHEDQKFGLSLAAGPDGGDSPALTALLRVLDHPELHLLGIHSHIGSQILDSSGFAVAAHRVLELRARLRDRAGVLVDEVDLGGGYGIAYLPGGVPLDPDRIAKEVAQAVADAARELGTPLPRLSIEPGRAIVGPAGLTLYTVGTVKPVRLDDGRVRTYVSVDGGMSDNIRPALYGAQYHADVVSRASDAERVLARVVGKHCESGDIVVHEVLLPGDVRAGDLLAVAATGAYGRSMASNYNLLTRPPVVAVTAGESRVLVRRETVDDLLALDVCAT
ncbi:diaminopimelate decarboxylase [Cellulomonas wangsupingiae]|uniref:Diaminopimelate decarboxylase n=1 Tax=Cellulomonas wangsupingiae TaxID=2968085 RepID=A0ABY5KCN2_9CELL|nr:diaminopimelate decarboxylase [Cellulomonas wangsupingiae]MCC2334499.1 diaminopimelate decarboxylase [Cellulomonas wangsupingiae]UUI66158.1 diaminopimelate decarboxylase [Cellulomonas wangsupingiae]